MSSALTRAFSLLDVALLNSFLAIFLITSLVIERNLQIKDEQNNTNSEMEVISNNLSAYWYKNKRLPCPSYPEKDIFSDQAKSESRYLDECLSFYGVAESGQGEYYVGSLPINNLNLGMDYLTDAWGSKYVYLVRKDLVLSGDITVSKELINHRSKDVIWFSAESVNIENDYWYADTKSAGYILNNTDDFELYQLENESYVKSNNIYLTLDYLKSSILFDGLFEVDLEFELSLDSISITLNYDGFKCEIKAEGEQGYNHVEEVICLEKNNFALNYNVVNSALFFVFNDVQLFDIPVTFEDMNLSVISNANNLFLHEVIISKEQDIDLIRQYLGQGDLAKYEDVIVMNIANESIDFSFLIISNLRNRYASYNDAGELLTKGYNTENLMVFDDSFLPKVFKFSCIDLTFVCSVINKNLDYSLKLENLF